MEENYVRDWMFLVACLPVSLLLSFLPAFLVIRRFPKGSVQGVALAVIPQVIVGVILRQSEPLIAGLYPLADSWLDGWLTEPRMLVWLPWLMTVVGLFVTAVMLLLAIPFLWLLAKLPKSQAR